MTRTNDSKSEMIREFRRIYEKNPLVLVELDEFEIVYESDAAIYWYTRDSFVCRTINQSLRLNDLKMIFKLRHILGDIYSHLYQSYSSSSSSSSLMEKYYRGQSMSNEQFDYFKELKDQMISIDTYFSATSSFQVALMYSGKCNGDDHSTPIIFSIEKDPSIKTRPYSNISDYSLFPDEDETLFSIGTIFRIGNIFRLINCDNVWIIQLILIDQRDYQLQQTIA